MGVKYFTDAGIECTPEECKLIESLNRLAKKWEKDGKRLWLYSASGVLIGKTILYLRCFLTQVQIQIIL